jgi:ADP-heptose:LPS heptosyltransferase
MELLLISKVNESQLFILNALTNTIVTQFKEKILSISLILISNKKVEDNFLFLEKNYLEVKYIKNLNQLKQINKNKYDYLISIENSLLGLMISAIVNSNIKITFKRVFGSFVFNKTIPLKKTRYNFLNLMDVSNLLKHVFSNSMEIIPKYHHENPIVIKNHEMIHWIFNTNHSIDLVNADYVLIDIEFGNFQKSNHIKMISNLCDHLINNFKLKIIFISSQVEEFEVIINFSKKLTNENFIHSKQNLKDTINYFPLLKHSILIITNKFKVIHFLELINKAYYLIKGEWKLSRVFYPVFYFKNYSKKTIGEINYMIKNL